MEPVGVGALQLALKKLQQKLAAEGLFSPEHKQPLPRFARRIGFVTSPSGAAVRDFLEVIRRRWRGVEVFVIPARVQGEQAAGEIVAGIKLAQKITPPLDCLVIGRGGGSLEDLWCFNEEEVVRAIYACQIPTISAVGHEIDVTLSDLVADRRALTPSEAAEIVTPSADEVTTMLRGYRQRLSSALRSRADRVRERLSAITRSRAFRLPHDRVHEMMRRVDELELVLHRTMARKQTRSGERLAGMAARLEALSPLAVLSRGYSLTQDAAGNVITDAAQTAEGEQLTTRLASGRVISRVESIQAE
jgi:exodeoxyribonuclease VII large subunit